MGTYLVTWKWTWLNQQCRNTFYYVTSVGEPSASEWVDIADEIRADIDTNYKSKLSTDCTWDGISYRRVDAAGYITFDVVPTLGSLTGTAGTTSLPTQIALLLSNKGSTIRPNRARTYLPGTVEADLADGVYASGVRGVGETLIDLQSNLNGGGSNPLSRVAAQWNTSKTMVTATNDISGAATVAAVVPATQRRRRIGRGI